ncbi:MAG TPA: MFS transporter [Acidimicrobiales bacterium]
MDEGRDTIDEGVLSGGSPRPQSSILASATGTLALPILSLVLALTFFDNTIVTTVLAPVQSALHASVNQLQWVVNGYALTFASLMLVFGSLGDQFGRRRVMLGGVALFCAGSLLAALAPSIDVLIAGRVIMGVGAAASEPGTLSMIRHVYTGRRERAEALGVWSAVSGLGLALGPVIGGVLVGIWSWRAVFWFNVVFGLVALVMGALVLPENADPVRARLDLPGFVLGALTLAAASFATILGETAGYTSWWIIGLFALAGLSGLCFVLVERRSPNPMLDVAYFRSAPFSGSNLVAFATYFGTFSIFFLIALYLQVVGSRSPYATAVDFLPMAVAMVLASVFTGHWVARSGPRIPMTIGCLLTAGGILATNAVISPHSGFSPLGWTLLVAGTGIGIAMVPVTSSTLSVVPAEHSGMAASMTNTSRELGAVAGVAILGSLVNGQLTTNLAVKLTAIGIPKAFQSEVITAVTTGSFSSQAQHYKAGKAIEAIINKVVGAAYGAFGHGLDIALTASGSLMVVGAVVAFSTLRAGRLSPDSDPVEPG